MKTNIIFFRKNIKIQATKILDSLTNTVFQNKEERKEGITTSCGRIASIPAIIQAIGQRTLF
ncbi:MAG: hypothetical protein GVY26_12010 [Bacteroidetes bacterium]|jgi:hypothetical protein|nr:hypothetical protein [Bacteroidota bacterium]